MCVGTSPSQVAGYTGMRVPRALSPGCLLALACGLAGACTPDLRGLFPPRLTAPDGGEPDADSDAIEETPDAALDRSRDAAARGTDTTARPDAVPEARPSDARPPDTAPPPRPEDLALARGLLLSLPLDDGAAETTRDQSAYGNAALLQGESVWVDGRFGRALSLRGGGSLRVEGALIFNTISAAFTVSAWVQGPPAADADGVILSRYAGGAKGPLYAFGITAGRSRVQINFANGYFADLASDAALPRDTWVHVAATFDQTDVRLYVDGRLAGTAAYLLGIPPEVSPIVIGGAQTITGTASRFSGVLDEVMLYNRALTPAEVAALARGVRPPRLN